MTSTTCRRTATGSNINGVASSRRLGEDTEDNVVHQTDTVFRSFVYHMYVNNLTSQDDSPDVDGLPLLQPDLKDIVERQPVCSQVQIGRQLAAIGDDINARYSAQFNRMVRALNPQPETAYEVFAGVAKKLFDDGNINWGRVVTLLCFGYRLTVSVLQRGHVGFFTNIVRYVVQFVFVEKIATWIASQGGWRAVLSYIPDSIGWKTIGMILAVSAASVVATVYFARQQ